jgi:hypothetical protein
VEFVVVEALELQAFRAEVDQQADFHIIRFEVVDGLGKVVTSGCFAKRISGWRIGVRGNPLIRYCIRWSDWSWGMVSAFGGGGTVHEWGHEYIKEINDPYGSLHFENRINLPERSRGPAHRNG